jgi:Ser/Thr protein kinase RdoA (MazF antagonist)
MTHDPSGSMLKAMQPPSHVLDAFSRLAGVRWDFLGHRGGFSGARLWRGQRDGEAWCLKAWPPGGIDAVRLAEIHRLLRRGRDAGLTILPMPFEPVVEHDNRVWDACTWLPGVADYQARPTPARLANTCVALARLHRAWSSEPARHGPCPGILRRLDALSAWTALVQSGWRPQCAAADPVRPAAERAWTLLPHRLHEALTQLTAWREVALPIQPCWCDLWHDHVLFTGDHVAGFIDYGSVKDDHAAVDLARMLGSLVGDDVGMWQAGLDAYHTIRPLRDDERALARVLDRTGLVVAAANWLRWLYHEGKSYDDRAAVAERLSGIVRRLE